jgi:hypothetical protein
VVAGIVLFIAFGIGACFMLLQWKAMRAEAEVHRQEVLRRGPVPRAEAVRTTLVTGGIYLSLGLAFFVGWRMAGLGAGIIAAVVTAGVGALVAAAWAIRAGWVSRD